MHSNSEVDNSNNNHDYLFRWWYEKRTNQKEDAEPTDRNHKRDDGLLLSGRWCGRMFGKRFVGKELVTKCCPPCRPDANDTRRPIDEELLFEPIVYYRCGTFKDKVVVDVESCATRHVSVFEADIVSHGRLNSPFSCCHGRTRI